jgi:Ca-activated chloride channel family protein
MSFFHNLEPRSRRIVFLATLAYLASVALLLVLARTSQATVAAPRPVDAVRSELIMIGGEGDKLFRAPLQSTEVEIYVSGPVARARVRQIYYNPFDEWMEGVYVYPLPENSAVDRLTMVIGERKVEGVVKEKEEARRTYERARQAGQRASLVSQERPNIFTTEVANIGPKERIVVEIEYQEALKFDGSAFALRFPMVVRPRFSPGEPITGRPPSGSGWSFDTKEVPDASRITPPILDPQAGSINPVRISVFLDAGFPLSEVVSSYHPIEVIREGNGKAEVRLKEGEVPADRDFVLRWSPQPGKAPIAGAFSQIIDGQAYHLIMIVPPSVVSTQEVKAHIPRELVYIIDVSGSMAGDAIREAKTALQYSLGRLKPGDRFNIIAFSNDARALWSDARAFSDATIAEAKGFIQALEANGGTNMASALAIALNGRADLEHLRQIIFITDGAVGNEEALFQMIHKGLGDSRLFTVGISAAPNSFFMSEAAEIGRGTYTFIGAMDEVEEHMDGLFKQISSPILTDIEVAWPEGVKAVSFPDPIPDLYTGDPVIFTARTSVEIKGKVTVKGRAAGTSWSRTVTIDVADRAGVASLWARAKILEITRAARRDYSWGGAEFKAAVVAVALKHRLVSQYTSLVAVDPEVVRPASERLIKGPVPTNLPADMDPAFLKGQRQDASSIVAKSPMALPLVQSQPQQETVMTRSERLKAALGRAVPQLALPQTATGSDLKVRIGLIIILLSMAIIIWLTWRGQRRRICRRI